MNTENKNNHSFLLKDDTKPSSFIGNINLLVSKLTDIVEINSKLDEEQIEKLLLLTDVDISIIADDLLKGTFNGNRKIDIDLFKNYKEYSKNLTEEQKTSLYNNESKAPTYNAITFGFIDGSEYRLEFKQGNLPYYIKTNQELYTQLATNDELAEKLNNTIISEVPVEISNTMVRIHDKLASSNIISITLHRKGGGELRTSPVYSWMDYTSSLQMIVTYIEQILAIYNSLPDIIGTAALTLELLDKVNKIKDELQTLYNQLVEDLNNYTNTKKEEIDEFSNTKLEQIGQTSNSNIENINKVSDTWLKKIEMTGNSKNNTLITTGSEYVNEIINTYNESTDLLNTATDQSINRVKSEGDKQINNIIGEGDKQSDRVVKISESIIGSMYDYAEDAKLSADKAEAALNNAEAVVGIGIGSKEKAGILRVGEGIDVTTDGIISIRKAVVVSKPTVEFVSKVAIGYDYTVIMSASTINIATISHFNVKIDDGEFVRVDSDSNGSASYTFTVEGLDLQVGKIEVIAYSTNSDASLSTIITYQKRETRVDAVIILEPTNNSDDIYPQPNIRLSSFNVPYFTDTPTNTKIQISSKDFSAESFDESTDIVVSYDGTYTTEWLVPQFLDINTTYYVRAKHTGDFFGEGEWGTVTKFTIVNVILKAPRVAGIHDGEEDVYPTPTLTISAFNTIPIVFDTPRDTDNLYYELKNLDKIGTDEEIIESGYRTLAIQGGTITFDNKLPKATHIQMECYWLGKILKGESNIITFTTTDIIVNEPIITGIDNNEVNVDLFPTITVGRYSCTPDGLEELADTNNFAYTIKKVADDTIVEDKVITLHTSGGTIAFENILSIDTIYTLTCKWLGKEIVGRETIIQFTTLNVTVEPPTVSGINDGDVDVLFKPEITIGIFKIIPTNYDEPRLLRYKFVNNADLSIIEEGTKDFTKDGGTITPTEDLPVLTNITFVCNWETNLFIGPETAITFTTSDLSILAPVITDGVTEGATDIWQDATITVAAPVIIPAGYDLLADTDNFHYTITQGDEVKVDKTVTFTVDGGTFQLENLDINTDTVLKCKWICKGLESDETIITFTTIDVHIDAPVYTLIDESENNWPINISSMVLKPFTVTPEGYDTPQGLMMKITTRIDNVEEVIFEKLVNVSSTGSITDTLPTLPNKKVVIIECWWVGNKLISPINRKIKIVMDYYTKPITFTYTKPVLNEHKISLNITGDLYNFSDITISPLRIYTTDIDNSELEIQATHTKTEWELWDAENTTKIIDTISSTENLTSIPESIKLKLEDLGSTYTLRCRQYDGNVNIWTDWNNKTFTISTTYRDEMWNPNFPTKEIVAKVYRIDSGFSENPCSTCGNHPIKLINPQHLSNIGTLTFKRRRNNVDTEIADITNVGKANLAINDLIIIRGHPKKGKSVDFYFAWSSSFCFVQTNPGLPSQTSCTTSYVICEFISGVPPYLPRGLANFCISNSYDFRFINNFYDNNTHTKIVGRVFAEPIGTGITIPSIIDIFKKLDNLIDVSSAFYACSQFTPVIRFHQRNITNVEYFAQGCKSKGIVYVPRGSITAQTFKTSATANVNVIEE